MPIFDHNMLIALLQNPGVQSFIISLAAGAAWDGAKKTVSHIAAKDESLAEQILSIIAHTMQQFYDDQIYGYGGEAYDESVVMEEFCAQFSKYGGIKNSGTLRSIVDGTLYPGLTDNQYKRWVDILLRNCSANSTVCNWAMLQNSKNQLFMGRNSVLQRIEARLKGYAERKRDETAGIADIGTADIGFDSIFEALNERFRCSWKDDLLHQVDKLSTDDYNQKKIEDKLAFIKSNEDCCDALAQIKELISLYDLPNSDREVRRELFEHMQSISFNKVLIIAGTTGAGKSFFINKYVNQSIKLLQEEAAEIIPCVIDCSRLRDISCFEQMILQELGDFLGENVPSLDAAHQMLESLSIKVCFVMDSVHTIIDQLSDWRNIAVGIRKFSRYETFKWILTINAYDYYMLEDTQEFLQLYCVKRESILREDSDKPEIFDHALSIDELNRDYEVVKQILEDKFNITVPEPCTDIWQGISTPLEAIYFGDCAMGETIISFPATYYEYITKIVSWKSEALAEHSSPEIQQTLLKIVDSVIGTRTCLIHNINALESDLNTFRHVQLLSRIETKNTDVFSLAQSFPDVSYQLRVFPYWAAKIVGARFQADTFDAANLLSFPHELKEWIIPCYIFINFEKANKWDDLFFTLKEGRLLEYALFCAQRSSAKFCHALYDFLLQNMEYVSGSRQCYAVLHFLYYCSLKLSEKFKLFAGIAAQVQKCSLNNLFERVFESIVTTSGTSKKLKKNMLELTTCNISDINFIFGYKTAQVYMQLVREEGQDFNQLLYEIIHYIDNNPHLKQQIKTSSGANSSFMDFFIRKCFEEHICSSNLLLEDIYFQLEKFFDLEPPIGTYIKRNLTCAAGNIFSSRKKFLSGYNMQYIQLTKTFADSQEVYEQKTAYFLIKNSLSKYNSRLDSELREVLIKLRTHHKIKQLYARDRDLFGLD